jgi:ribosomal protein L24
MIKKGDTVRILHGNRAGVQAKVITDGPFRGEILQVVRDGHYAKI